MAVTPELDESLILFPGYVAGAPEEIVKRSDHWLVVILSAGVALTARLRSHEQALAFARMFAPAARVNDDGYLVTGADSLSVGSIEQVEAVSTIAHAAPGAG